MHRITKWFLAVATVLAFLLAGYLYLDRASLKTQIALKTKVAEQQQSELEQYRALKAALHALLKTDATLSDESLDDAQLLAELRHALATFKSTNDSLRKNLTEKVGTTASLSLQVQHLQSTLHGYQAEKAFVLHQLDATHHERDSLYQALTKTMRMLDEMRLDSLTFVSPKGVTVSYYGKILNGQPFGFGIGFYKGKGYYVGEWNSNMRHGQGKHVYLNGDIYEGEFVNDQREGYGIYRYASGEIYEGEWKADLMNGVGKFTFKDGDVQSGIWQEGKIKNN
ncbi:MAG: MORN repeat-containing protein [Candidatus Thermochlorobacter sp.]